MAEAHTLPAFRYWFRASTLGAGVRHQAAVGRWVNCRGVLVGTSILPHGSRITRDDDRPLPLTGWRPGSLIASRAGIAGWAADRGRAARLRLQPARRAASFGTARSLQSGRFGLRNVQGAKRPDTYHQRWPATRSAEYPTTNETRLGMIGSESILGSHQGIPASPVGLDRGHLSPSTADRRAERSASAPASVVALTAGRGDRSPE